MEYLLNPFGLYYESSPHIGEVGITTQASREDTKYFIWIFWWKVKHVQ